MVGVCDVDYCHSRVDGHRGREEAASPADERGQQSAEQRTHHDEDGEKTDCQDKKVSNDNVAYKHLHFVLLTEPGSHFQIQGYVGLVLLVRGQGDGAVAHLGAGGRRREQQEAVARVLREGSAQGERGTVSGHQKYVLKKRQWSFLF